MEIIKECLNINYISYFVTTIIIISAIIFIIEVFVKFFNFLNIPIRWVRTKDRDHELLEEMKHNFETIESKRLKDLEQSNKNDEEIKAMLDSTLKMLENHIKTDNRRTIVTLRSMLYNMHNEFVSLGYVTNAGLKTFLDCGNAYEEAGGNDIYHDKLKPEVLELPIRDIQNNEADTR